MISLRQLRYFEAVARTRHFGKAAEQCAVTQPALSMQVQELEKTLGVQLLERSRNGVLLTEAGRDPASVRIQVQGRPDRIFIKLHCHGAADANRHALLGEDLKSKRNGFLKDYNRALRDLAAKDPRVKVYFDPP